MSELRVLRCTREAYSIVASYAGQNELSLCQALTQIVTGTSGDVETEPQKQVPWQFIKDHLDNQPSPGTAPEAEPAQQEVQEPWKWWRDHYERERIRLENLESTG